MRPVCVPCRRTYRPKKNGMAFVEMANGRQYKLWMGDLWKCPGCGHELISGVGLKPIAEHYQERFAPQVRAWNAELEIEE